MSIARNSIANVVGALAPVIVTLITVPIYIGLIGEERYGALAVLWVILTYFYFFDVGLGKATSQRISKLGVDTKGDASKILWTSITLTMCLGIVGGLVLWFFADLILTNFISMENSTRIEVRGAIHWLIIALPVLVVNSAMGGALQARERFIEINIVAILCNVANQTIPLMVAMSGNLKLDFLVPASFVGNAMMTMVYFCLCRKYVPISIRPNVSKEQIKPLLHYGGGISLISMVGPLLVTIDRVFMGAMLGAKSVAYYTVPYSLVSRMLVISGGLSGAIFPRLAAASSEDARALSIRSTKSLMTIMTPITIIGVTCIHPFLVLWIGEEFASHSKGVGELLFFGIWINTLVTAHFARLQASGKLKKILLIFLIELPVYFLMLWFGMKYWGLVGAAAAWSLRVSLDTVLLLKAGNVLSETIKDNAYLMVLVSTTVVLSLWLDPFGLSKFIFSLLILCVSTAIGWEEIVRLSKSIINKNR